MRSRAFFEPGKIYFQNDNQYRDAPVGTQTPGEIYAPVGTQTPGEIYFFIM